MAHSGFGTFRLARSFRHLDAKIDRKIMLNFTLIAFGLSPKQTVKGRYSLLVKMALFYKQM
jgi:hypothetical protein